MGTTFRLVFYAGDDSLAKKAASHAFKKVENLNAILSDYERDSELNILSRNSGSGEWYPVSASLFAMLKKAQHVSRLTNGAFDITVGPYVQLWRKLQRAYNPRLPAPDTLKKLSLAVGFRHIDIDKKNQSVRLSQPHMQLDPGGIAKGFAADEALKMLYSHGIRPALVDAGGDIVLGDAPPGKKGWNITFQSQKADGKMESIYLTLANKAIATSGDLFQYTEIDGKRYSHIINPATGLGLTNQSTVTVIAPDGITADSYASAVSVLGPRKGIAFLENQAEISGFVEYHSGDSLKHIQTADLKRRFVETP
jgi:thiamine biosynthesis lipoprotein